MLPTCGLVLFVLWPVVWSSHLVLSTHHQSRPALLLPWLKWWVVAGLSFGLGVGPAPPILMSTLFSPNMKSTGITIGFVVRALVNTIQFKVGSF